MNTDEKIQDITAKKRLFMQQKELLDTFLSTGALTKAQYDKSLHGLAEKMNLEDLLQSHAGESNG